MTRPGSRFRFGIGSYHVRDHDPLLVRATKLAGVKATNTVPGSNALCRGLGLFHESKSTISSDAPRCVDFIFIGKVMAASRYALPVDTSVVRLRQAGALQALHSANLPWGSPVDTLRHVRPPRPASTSGSP